MSKNVAFEVQFKDFFIPWKCHVPFLRYSNFHSPSALKVVT